MTLHFPVILLQTPSIEAATIVPGRQKTSVNHTTLTACPYTDS